MKSRAILPGSTLGFVGPSGVLPDADKLLRAVAKIESMGYHVIMGESCLARYGYLSGSDELRASDLNRMFADDSVDAVVCTRGGYGTPRILDRLDYAAAARSPKPLIGYSDITGLHLAYYKACGLKTYHAPMPTNDWTLKDGFDAFSMASLLDSLAGGQVGVPIENPPGYSLECLQEGVAEGVLLGGNLTLICTLLGTPYMPDLTGAILLLEDVDEPLYCIDRLLTQVRLSGAFDACAGVVLGDFTNCKPEYADRSIALDQILRDVVLPAGKPVVSGFMIGHCTPKITVPLGVKYRLDAQNTALTLLEHPYT